MTEQRIAHNIHVPFYQLGNTYCAVCKEWLHAGRPKDEEFGAVNAELAALRGENQRLTKAMRALESFTPSGSEFVNDITRCSQFIRERISRSHEIAIQAVIGRKSAESSLARAQETLRKIAAIAQFHTDRGGTPAYLFGEVLTLATAELEPKEEGRAED